MITSIKIRIKSTKQFIEDHEYTTDIVGTHEIDIYFNGMYVHCVRNFEEVLEYIGNMSQVMRDVRAYKKLKAV